MFDSREAGLDAFGWNFANVALAEALERVAAPLPTLTTLEQPAAGIALGADGAELTLHDGSSVQAALVVGADGRNSMVRGAAGIAVREHRFEQAALVSDLMLQRPLGDQSVEFHYERGPFTLVPAGGNRANLVWIEDRAVLSAGQAQPSWLRLLARKHCFGRRSNLPVRR